MLTFHKHARRELHFEGKDLRAAPLAAPRPAPRAGFAAPIPDPRFPTPDDAGWIEGYLAVWDNLDLGGEIMRKGCFSRSVEQAVPAGKVPLMVRHLRDGGDAVDCIGMITQAREDDYGLWIHAPLDPTGLAQDLRTRILAGEVKGLSVGYLPLRYQFNRGVVEHLEAKLLEGTVTLRPMNPAAAIVAAKSVAVAVDPSDPPDSPDSPQPQQQQQAPSPPPAGTPAPSPAGPLAAKSAAPAMHDPEEMRREVEWAGACCEALALETD